MGEDAGSFNLLYEVGQAASVVELRCDNGGGYSANSDTVWAEEIRKTLGDTEDGSLGATVGEASSRNGLSNNRRDVDDTSSLLLDSRSERTVVGVLGVDSIGDASVDNEGTKGVNVQEFLHDRNTVLQLVVPLTSRCNGRTVNATKELDTLGKCLESSLTRGIDLLGVDNVGFEIESLLSVIALDLGGAGLLIQHVEDHNHSAPSNDVTRDRTTNGTGTTGNNVSSA